MITFIIWLRCLAAMLITNSHYTGIYPTDLIANGGLIGDVLFFAVSGYCLTNIKTSFPKWYGKRLKRIVPTVLLITGLYALLSLYEIGAYAPGTENMPLYMFFELFDIAYPAWMSWFLYPTAYHFVTSILILYIPYYFIIKCKKTREHLPTVMLVILVLYALVYLFLYDKGRYHVDAVQEPFIRFLFMESMLLGAYFKINDEKLRVQKHVLRNVLCTGIAAVLYFIGKIGFSKGIFPPSLQFVNQMLIFVLLYFLMRWAASMDGIFEKAPKWLSRAVGFVASITLEIYLVQSVLIDAIRHCELIFPLNWVILTALIVICAFVLHLVIEYLEKAVSALTVKKEKTQR